MNIIGSKTSSVEFVTEKARPMVKAITVQEVVAAIRASGRHPWLDEFERKYGLD